MEKGNSVVGKKNTWKGHRHRRQPDMPGEQGVAEGRGGGSKER